MFYWQCRLHLIIVRNTVCCVQYIFVICCLIKLWGFAAYLTYFVSRVDLCSPLWHVASCLAGSLHDVPTTCSVFSAVCSSSLKYCILYCYGPAVPFSILVKYENGKFVQGTCVVDVFVWCARICLYACFNWCTSFVLMFTLIWTPNVIELV